LKSNIIPPIEVRADSDEYQFINPLIFSRTSKSFYLEEFKLLNDSINNQINNYKKEGILKRASVYFRDLNTGHWTGINEDDKYDPSSLLKVILFMSYLKDINNNPDILLKKLYYNGFDDRGQYYKSNDRLSAGEYTTLELIRTMIEDSDNVAREVLIKNNTKSFENTYKDFRLPLPISLDNNDYMSARSYSVIFRSLYNSTYLSWKISEQALSLLSLTKFKNGIVAGIPKDITVSHKFGEHTYIDSNNNVESRELHDCGIVYYTLHPYLICIMTQGNEFKDLERVISSISEIVYNYISKR
jgi:hypothetical protein